MEELFKLVAASLEARKAAVAAHAVARADFTAFWGALTVLYPDIKLGDTKEHNMDYEPSVSAPVIAGENTPFKIALKLKSDAQQNGQSTSETFQETAFIAIEISERLPAWGSVLQQIAPEYDLSRPGVFDQFKKDIVVFCGILRGDEKPRANEASLTPQQREILRFDTGKAYTAKPEIR